MTIYYTLYACLVLASVTLLVASEYKLLVRRRSLNRHVPEGFGVLGAARNTWKLRRVAAARQRWMSEQADSDLQLWVPATTDNERPQPKGLLLNESN